MVRWLILISCVWLAGCATNPHSVPVNRVSLLSAQEVFGHEVPIPEASDAAILTLTPAIEAWIDRKTENYPSASGRLRRLLEGMIEDGLLNLVYEDNSTLTAREVFESKQGNCLAFSNLFVAMARYADLNASFQMVDIPPSFTSEGDLVLLNNHINVVVQGVRISPNFVKEHVVDFNSSNFNGNYPARKVTDQYAYALYFSNRGVEALRDSDYEAAWGFFRAAIRTDGRNADHWVNLGYLLAVMKRDDLSIQAYQQALNLQANNKSALVNLVWLHKRRGDEAAMRFYQAQVDYYLNHNPYYLLELAQQAYQRGDNDAAMAALNRAISLKNDEHQLYFMRALVWLREGDMAAVRQDLDMARSYALNEQQVKRYNTKLAAL
ncbi:MAG: hypothetical protein KDI36_16755, partial [Pseudomonadales bacterium]|nr:hypothetical protein [Pseudomonadales bacterium]